jgi:DNA invertase Pin-like site-specific DNA recombinase
MALVYSYIRFSTKKQMEGDSFRRQVEEGLAWIKKHGHTPASLTLHDLGVPAFKGRNKHAGALRKFLDAIRDGRVKPGAILLVENLDRLSRQGVDEAYDLFRTILKAGVQIAVLRPYEATYDNGSLNDFISLLMPLLYFHLAHIESKNKSDRVRASWDTKRKKATESGRSFGGPKPSWLDWDETTGKYVPNAGAAAVHFIFERVAEGCSQRQLLGELHDRHPAIGRSGKWNGSYIHKVVNDRAVLGEFQLYHFDVDGNRVPVGKPLAGYYPAVVDEPLFYRAHGAKARNLKQKGPTGDFVNLFTGLVFNANDGHSMHQQVTTGPDKKKFRRLVSYGHHRKMPDCDSVGLALKPFEWAVLTFMSELSVEDVQPQTDGAATLRKKEQELAGVRQRLADIEGELADVAGGGSVKAALAAARNLEVKAETLKQEVEQLRQESHAERPLGQAQKAWELLQKAPTKDVPALRLRLRSLLAELIKVIYVKPQRFLGRVYALVQIDLCNGRRRQITIGPNLGGLPASDGGPCNSHIAIGQINAHRADNFKVDLADRAATASFDVVRCNEGGETAVILLGFKNGTTLWVPLDPGNTPTGLAGGGDDSNELPKTLGPAADRWLRTVRQSMRRLSFRVVPSKVRRFVDFLGTDTPTANVNAAAWKRWTKRLRRQVKGGQLAHLTARVAYSRCREFVRWLVDNKLTAAFDGLSQSADAALGGLPPRGSDSVEDATAASGSPTAGE